MVECLELSREAAALQLGLSELDYDGLTRGQFRNRSLEELIGFVIQLGGAVSISVFMEEKTAAKS